MDKKEKFLEILENRFLTNNQRHRNVEWSEIKKILESDLQIMESLIKMEESAGEPDVFLINGSLYFIDASLETPKGRVGLCYDIEARVNRKKYPPLSSVEEVANEMGVKLVDEAMYFEMQKLGDFDQKTSSWLKTEDELRKKGGAILGDKRYGRTFIYHNGADSYYGSRGFRAFIKINK